MRRAARAFSWCLGMVLSAACADEPAPERPLVAVTFESGARLRANVWVTEDGSEIFVDFHDRELDLDCSFEETSAGFRCLPPHSLDKSLSFHDDECKTPIALARLEGCLSTSPFVVARGEETGCPLPEGLPVSAFYRATTEHEGEESFLGAPDACAGPFWTGAVWFELEELPLADFAAAEEHLIDATNGLATRMLVSPDGAKVAIGLFDSARQQRCTAYRDGPDLFRCVPDAFVMTAREIVVGDCSSPDASVPGVLSHGECQPPALVVDRLLACPPSLEVFATGEPVSGEEAIFTFDCEPVSGTYPEDFKVLPLADPVDKTELLAVHSRQNGLGRVTSRVAVAEDGSVLGVPLNTSPFAGELRMFDELLEQPCWPMVDGDGVWRCVSGPRFFADAGLYTDPDCTSTPIFVAPCGLAVASVGFVADCDSGPLTGAVGIGAPAPQSYFSDGAGCVLFGAQPNTFLVTGDRSLDEFPRLEKKRL